VGPSPAFSLLSLALFFFLPGFFLMRALFPERTLAGPHGPLHVVESVAGGVFLSVALTILIGFGLGNGPGTFQATPTEPWLQLGLAAITLIGLAVAWQRGGLSLAQSSRSLSEDAPETREAHDLDLWLREMQGIGREEARLRRHRDLARRRGMTTEPELEARLQELKERRRQLERQRVEGFYGR
jgi:hypothetical protein